MNEPTHEVTLTLTMTETDAKEMLAAVNDPDFRINTVSFRTPWRDIRTFAPLALSKWEIVPTQKDA